MKGYFFSQLQKDNFGPQKKIRAQVYAFNKSGLDTKLVEAPVVDTGFLRGNFLMRQFVSRLPFTYVYSKYKWIEEYKDADFYYIRCMVGDWHFTHFLKTLRKNNKKAKILLEFPDFPATYFMTVSLLYRLIYLPDLIKDLISHRQYRKYVDRVTMLDTRKEVYGIPVIRFMNGVNIDQVKKKKPSDVDRIKLIAVAAMKPFHGYERIIEGLHRYYLNGGDRQIELNLVGGDDTPMTEISKYKELVDKYGLHDKVIFHGVKEGEELDTVYDECNIAIGSLAMFRFGYFDQVSSLKTREYLAKGLPLIAGNPIDVIEEGFPYFLKYSNDDSAIDIDRLVEFYDSIYKDVPEQTVIDTIRRYAEEHCDTTATMKDVIDFIKGETE